MNMFQVVMIVLCSVTCIVAVLIYVKDKDKDRNQGITEDLMHFQTAVNETIHQFEGRLNMAISGLKEDNERQLGRVDGTLKEKIGQQQTDNARKLDDMRKTVSDTILQFDERLNRTIKDLKDENDKRLGQIDTTLKEKIKDLQNDNAKKIEEMRQTVDEKLEKTLSKRLDDSFSNMVELLKNVQTGLGEMQSMAKEVGNLRSTLTNVKTRGMWGEVQLERLLSDLMTPEQYARQVMVKPDSKELADFAIRLPGQEGGEPLWMAIDSKFPVENYTRYRDAVEAGDSEGISKSLSDFEKDVRNQAKSIAGKYIDPPHTTDFAVMFLPTEGLYAEVMSRPGLAVDLQNSFRITVCGPSTLAALLNSLQLGFKTLAIEKRSSEVWQLLSAVKAEFGKFSDVLEKTSKSLNAVQNHIKNVQQRTRVMNRTLKTVEVIGTAEAENLLGLDELSGSGEEEKA